MPIEITALPLGPDTTWTTPAQGSQSWADSAWAWITELPTGVWYALAAAVITAGLISSIRIATAAKKNRPSLTGDKLLTFLAAGVSTSVVATGMWKFFGDVLGIENPIARGALFAVFEIAMLASAFRSRRFRLDRAAKREADPQHNDQRIDVDGIAVWVLALVSGCFAAADETTNTAKAVRVVVPLLAAWMWERGLAGELMQFTRGAKRLNMRVTPERVLVWLGLAEPTSRGIGEVARRRRIARFARTAFRLHLLTETGTEMGRVRSLRVSWLRWRLRRQTEAGNEHLNLAGDQSALHDVRMQMALLYGAEEGTSRDAVRELTPLKPVKRREITAEPHAPDAPSQAASHEPSQSGSHDLLTEVRTGLAEGFALAVPEPSLPPSREEGAAASADAHSPERAAESPVEKVVEGAAAKVAKAPRAPQLALADDGPDSVRKLAAAFARKPGGTNAELAKLAKVSIGSANRHLPKIRAAAASPEKPVERPAPSQRPSQSPLIPTRIESPKPYVNQGVNGYDKTTQETQ